MSTVKIGRRIFRLGSTYCAKRHPPGSHHRRLLGVLDGGVWYRTGGGKFKIGSRKAWGSWAGVEVAP
jgi:hypothetical protein